MDYINKFFSSEQQRTRVFIILSAILLVSALFINKQPSVPTITGVAIALQTDQSIPQGRRVYLTVHNNDNSFVRVFEGRVVGSIRDKGLLIVLVKDQTVKEYIGKMNIDLTL